MLHILVSAYMVAEIDKERSISDGRYIGSWDLVYSSGRRTLYVKFPRFAYNKSAKVKHATVKNNHGNTANVQSDLNEN